MSARLHTLRRPRTSRSLLLLVLGIFLLVWGAPLALVFA